MHKDRIEDYTEEMLVAAIKSFPNNKRARGRFVFIAKGITPIELYQKVPSEVEKEVSRYIGECDAQNMTPFISSHLEFKKDDFHVIEKSYKPLARVADYFVAHGMIPTIQAVIDERMINPREVQEAIAHVTYDVGSRRAMQVFRGQYLEAELRYSDLFSVRLSQEYPGSSSIDLAFESQPPSEGLFLTITSGIPKDQAERTLRWFEGLKTK